MKKIGYIQIGQDVVLDIGKEGFFKALADSGFIQGEHYKLIDNNAQGELSMIPTILQSFQAQGVDLIVTNGTPCMVAAAQVASQIPVVFTISFGPEQMKLKSIPTNLYGVYDPLDVSRIAERFCACIPSLDIVGIPYNNSEPNAEYSAKVFAREFEKRGIAVERASVTSTNDLPMVVQSLIDRSVDALVITADNLIYRGLNVVGKMAGENKVPLLVTEPMQVEKGAAVGMGINYEYWGYLSGLKAVEILRGRQITQKIEPITDLDWIVNTKACEEQGLVLPPELIREARIIH